MEKFMTLPQSSLPLAIVTGGTSGIGLAIVKDLARDHHVLALGRDPQRIAQITGLKNITPVAVDLVDHESLAQLVAPLEKISVLVHCAAISEKFTTAEASPNDWRRHMEINLIAPAELSRLSLPALRRAEGQVIFISSGAGIRSIPGHTVYSASKHALRALADGLRIDEAKHRVRVATVAPGPTQTPKTVSLRDDPQTQELYESFSTPESIAAGVRVVVDATDDSQVTEVVVRPRFE
jgi:NAD(P)-dependent dehydrogenase (short-subunit alcohol dehydrogenase family)